MNKQKSFAMYLTSSARSSRRLSPYFLEPLSFRSTTRDETRKQNNIHTLKNPDPEMKKHFQDLFELWNTKIDEYLNESEAGSLKPKYNDPGLRSELEYWRKRMQKLSCLSEEMRSPHCKIVQNVINHISSNANDNPGRNIYLLQSKWRTQDMNITETLNEAKDNVKYLITLEPFITPLYEETPDVVKDTFLL